MGVIFKNKVMYGAGDIEISPVCYSEEEREVGCWTDGKPLYEKTFYFSSVGTGSVDKDISLPDAEYAFIVNANGIDTGGSKLPMPFVHTTASSNAGVFINSTFTKLSFRIGSSQNISNAYVTVRYTKTTDTSGSGTWTPSGVPAVHYSTDEHIIGTWADGSTLYEITKQLSSPVQIASQGVEIDFGSMVADVDLVIDAKALRPSSSQYGSAASSVFVRKASGATTKLTFYSGVSFAGAEYITICYTKSA